MSQGPEVAIAITADSKGVTAEIARVTQSVNADGQVVGRDERYRGQDIP